MIETNLRGDPVRIGVYWVFASEGVCVVLPPDASPVPLSPPSTRRHDHTTCPATALAGACCSGDVIATQKKFEK